MPMKLQLKQPLKLVLEHRKLERHQLQLTWQLSQMRWQLVVDRQRFD